MHNFIFQPIGARVGLRIGRVCQSNLMVLPFLVDVLEAHLARNCFPLDLIDAVGFGKCRFCDPMH